MLRLTWENSTLMTCCINNSRVSGCRGVNSWKEQLERQDTLHRLKLLEENEYKDARVNKHSYPVMSESEVAEQLQTMFPDRLTGLDLNPHNPDLVHLVVSLFVEVLLGVSAEEQTMLPLSVLTRYTRHPEMHSNTRCHFFVLVRRLTHNDFANPTTRRWLNVFSGLINFFKRAMSMRTKQSEIRRGRQAVLDERGRLQRQTADLRRKRADGECRRVERELQTKAMQRDAREKAVANRGLAERLAARRAAVEEQRRRSGRRRCSCRRAPRTDWRWRATRVVPRSA